MPHFDHFPRPGEIDPYEINVHCAFGGNLISFGQLGLIRQLVRQLQKPITYSYEGTSTFILWYGLMVKMMITMNDKQTNIADNNQVGILTHFNLCKWQKCFLTRELEWYVILLYQQIQSKLDHIERWQHHTYSKPYPIPSKEEKSETGKISADFCEPFKFWRSLHCTSCCP